MAPYSGRSVLGESVTVEECARRCLLAADRPCHGFNYRPTHAHSRPCTLLHPADGRRSGLPTVYADDTDFYQRQPGCTSLTSNTRTVENFMIDPSLYLALRARPWLRIAKLRPERSI